MLSYGKEIEHLLYVIATNLFYPVMIVEILALVYVLMEFGGFLFEVVGRRFYRDFAKFEENVFQAGRYMQDNNWDDAAQALPDIKYSNLLREAINLSRQALVDGTFHLKSEKIMQTAEIMSSRQLQGPRVLTRVGPMLGLMGTLIPLGPALQALTKGDLQTLANNLTIAFVTTVIGLLIGGFGYAVNLFKDSMQSQDLSDLEYLITILIQYNRQGEGQICTREGKEEEYLTAMETR
ncbi:MAG: MotA/TolQ/ExbB proton channel family protein [Firmicutes bacterium HGW-Firmicutes-8]|nr:MAG: MotA/TolQ/ExbB proton channel family protein [Firmicutes bacterium HGW-Firmicutes-8]